MALPIGTGGGAGYGPVAPPVAAPIPQPYLPPPPPPSGYWQDLPGAPAQTWADLFANDPALQQQLAALAAESVSDRANTATGLRQALIRMGGAGIQGAVGKLGASWADLLDPTTLAAAQAADQSGVSLSAQMAKAHADKLLAEEDIRAAKGILSSGQSGYEIGAENQRDVIAQNEALSQLLSFLQGGVGEYASREGQRNTGKSGLYGNTMDRLIAMGLSPNAGTPASRQWVPNAPAPAAAARASAGPGVARSAMRPFTPIPGRRRRRNTGLVE